MTARSKPRSLADDPAARRAGAPMRPAFWRFCFTATPLCALLALGGCVPVAGDVVHAESTAPVETPLAEGEKIIVAGEKPEWDDSNYVRCVQGAAQEWLPQDSLMEAAVLREKSGGILTSSEAPALQKLAEDVTALEKLKPLGVKHVVLIRASTSSDIQGAYGGAGGESATTMIADILDIETGSVSGPLSVTVSGHTFIFLGVGVWALTEGPACRHLAALIVSAVTRTPLASLDPEIVPAISAAEAEREERQRQEAEKRLEIAETYDAYVDRWARLCRDAFSNDGSPIEIYNGTWIGLSYRVGTAPGGPDDLTAYVWFAVTDDRRNTPVRRPVDQLLLKIAQDQMAETMASLSEPRRTAAREAAANWRPRPASCETGDRHLSPENLDQWVDARLRFDRLWNNLFLEELDAVSRRFINVCNGAMAEIPFSMSEAARYFHVGNAPVGQDLTEAYKWYLLADERKLSFAGRRLDELRAEMTPAEIAEAERRAAEWWPDPSQCVAALETAEGS